MITPGIAIIDFRPLERNTLRGFAAVKVNAWNLIIHDVAIHEKEGRRWASLPARPMLDSNRQLMLDDTGKPKYSRVLEFTEREVGDRFSQAVVAAVDQFVAASKRIDADAEMF
jgi:hypothetical protein